MTYDTTFGHDINLNPGRVTPCLTCSWGIVVDFGGRLSEGMAFAVGEPKRIHGIDEATSMN